MRVLLGLSIALWAMAGVVHADDRAPTSAESAVIHNYQTRIGAAMDALSSGWTESTIARVDIDGDVQVDGTGDGPFLFYGNMARTYSRTNPDDPTAKMQALVTEMQTTTDPARQQTLISQIQALAANAQPASQSPDLWITTLHNLPTFALDGDSPVAVAAPKGVALAFKVPAMHVTGGTGYLLEFGDLGRMKRDTTSGVWRYDYAHRDGSPHIENIEIRIEGPADVVDKLVATYDWTQLTPALVP